MKVALDAQQVLKIYPSQYHNSGRLEVANFHHLDTEEKEDDLSEVA